MSDDIFGTSYRSKVKGQKSGVRFRDQLTPSTISDPLRHQSTTSRMNLSHYDSYNDVSALATQQHVSGTVLQPITRGSSKSALPEAHFIDVLANYEPAKRSAFTDPPKVSQLNMSATHRQEVDDEQWASPRTTPQCESSLKVGGVDWIFKLQKRALESVPHVGFTLVCGAKLKSALWRISANIRLDIRKKDGEKSVQRSYPGREFTFATKTLADMIPWEEIATAVGCGNRDDAKSPIVLIFELRIDISNSYGFRRRTQFEYSFFEPSIETDMVLLVENRKLYVNATYLSMLSPFFRSLKTSKNDGVHGEIRTETISDVSVEDFLQLLNVVYPSQLPVTVKNVEALLKLGDRYAFESVLVKCEDFLITPPADEIDVFTRLEWASKYAMADLQDHCVSKLNNAEDVAAVKKTLLYGTLSHETRKLLLELMLKFNNV